MTLHSMDQDIFLNSRKIHVKESARNHYYSLYNCNSFKECAYKWALHASDNYRMLHSGYIKRTYASIAKMILLNANSNIKLLQKIDAFYDFIVNELGAFTAREMYLAAICFSGRAGALVNVCKGTKYSKALRSMSATSWDLFLLRCPEIIAGTDKNDLPLGYVCTAEKKLADFAKLTSIKRLKYKNGDMSPPLLSLDLGSKDDKKTTIINDQIHHRHKNRESPFRDISDSDLNLLIKQLEHEIKNLCG
ncbi:MAG: hypothetical protein HN623_13465 [Bdellovibrionales bacterium]|nr:hypothetical protein [Bdellovibrionales bacterium]